MQQDLRGDFVAALAIPDLYAKNVGQVVAVSTEQLRYIRRKELAMQPFDIQVHDLSACQSIRYRQDFAPFRLLSGILFSGLAILIAVGIWYYGDRMATFALAPSFFSPMRASATWQEVADIR